MGNSMNVPLLSEIDDNNTPQYTLKKRSTRFTMDRVLIDEEVGENQICIVYKASKISSNNSTECSGTEDECTSVTSLSSFGSDEESGNNNNNHVILETPQPESIKIKSLKLLIGVIGVWSAHIGYGIVQEDLFRYRTTSEQEDGGSNNFHAIWFLQILESASSIILGIIGRYLFGGRTDLKLQPFFLSSSAQLFAKIFVSMALAAGAAFPVVTLAKCGKILPVMRGQLVLGGSKYGFLDYLFAIFIVGGTIMVSLNKQHDDSQQQGTFVGAAFIILSLVMDGVSGGLQKQLKRDMAATPPTTYDFVLYSHISMILISFIIAIITGDIWDGILMVQTDKQILRMIVKICILSVVGQSFIFFVVSTFDPLVCATITTTRKMWSVLLSIAFKGHHLNITGYSGLVIAIVGLFIEIYNKVTHQVDKQSQGINTKFGIKYDLLPKHSIIISANDDDNDHVENDQRKP